MKQQTHCLGNGEVFQSSAGLLLQGQRFSLLSHVTVTALRRVLPIKQHVFWKEMVPICMSIEEYDCIATATLDDLGYSCISTSYCSTAVSQQVETFRLLSKNGHENMEQHQQRQQIYSCAIGKYAS